MHDCFIRIDEQLKPRGFALDTSVTGATVKIATYALGSGKGRIAMAATFCPFCGSKLGSSVERVAAYRKHRAEQR